MSIQVSCPSRGCDQKLALSPEMAGKKGKCPKCGKSFQIPKNLGAGRTSASTGAAEGSAKPAPAAKKPAPAAKKPAPAAKKPTQRSGPEKVDPDEFASMLVDDDDPVAYDDDVVEDYEDYDATPQHAPARRRRDDYDDVDDLDDYHDGGGRRGGYRDDDDDDYYRGSRSRGGMSKKQRWKLTSVGMLIVAIAMCLFAGGLAFTFLSELLMQIAGVSRTSGMGMRNASANIYKIAQVFGIIAGVGLVVGYVFMIFAPNKYGSMGVAISTLVLGIISFVLQLIFVNISTLAGSAKVYSRAIHAGMAGGVMDGGDEVLSFFLELGIAVQFLLCSLFLAMVAKIQGNRQHRIDCMRVVWFLAGFCGLLLFMYIFVFISPVSGGKWLFYLVRVLNWLANGLLGTVLVFYIMNLFYSVKTTG